MFGTSQRRNPIIDRIPSWFAVYNIIYFMMCSLPLGDRVMIIIIIIIRDLDSSNSNNNNNFSCRLIDANPESGIRYRNRTSRG